MSHCIGEQIGVIPEPLPHHFVQHIHLLRHSAYGPEIGAPAHMVAPPRPRGLERVKDWLFSELRNEHAERA